MKRKTTEEFIQDAVKVHGDKYDYSKVNYINAHTKIDITCPEHGIFSQKPSNHLVGKGCTFCAPNYKKPVTHFISKANSLHGDIYDYSTVTYVNAHTKVSIVCRDHGVFWQTPANHVKGQGCPDCGKIARKEFFTSNTSEFVGKAKNIHGDKYLYDSVEYISAHVHVEVLCKKHGPFWVTPNHHLSGKNCPKCAVFGFDDESEGFLYVLVNSDRDLVKIGITANPKDRFTRLKRRTPFEFDLMECYKFELGLYASTLERFAHDLLVNQGLSGFDGATEWFKFDGGKLEELRHLVKQFGGAAY